MRLAKVTKKSGFTLIEVLIAASIFIVIATLSSQILVSTVQAEKKTDIRNAVYQDARIVMEQLANYIRANAIDYDEYYSVNVIQKDRLHFDDLTDDNSIAYGMYHGVYGSRFFSPGDFTLFDDLLGIDNPRNLGVECSDPLQKQADEDCEVIYTLSEDEITGTNPYEGKPNGPYYPDEANALCDEISDSSKNCTDTSNLVNELYLINEDTSEKIIIGTQVINQDDNAIGVLKLEALDIDQNGFSDLYTCKPDYNCSDDANQIFDQYFDKKDLGYPEIESASDVSDLGLKVAKKSHSTKPFDFDNSYFVPITPFRSSVTDLKFLIHPIEDPYKAYDEIDSQVHPSVTILLTMEPSAAEKARYPGTPPAPITIQRTVNTGVTKYIETYPPTNDLGWICNLMSTSFFCY